MASTLRQRGIVVAAVAALAASASGQSIERVSVSSSGGQADSSSAEGALSADGRFVAFSSLADNLVPNDTNGQVDIFVRDLLTGVTERVSVRSNGREANGGSSRPALSADGRFVSFESDATNLVAGDTNHLRDMFVHDRATGITEIASVDSAGVQADDHSFAASISADGQRVAFESGATNLVSGDTNGHFDVFLRDRAAATTTRVSVDSSGVQGNLASFTSAISADGGVVAFRSYATNLVPGDTNGFTDVFVHAIASGVTTRVSVASDGTQGNADSGYDAVAISADGGIVAFESAASNLVPGGIAVDVFLRDIALGVTERVSVADDGASANNICYLPSISADGNVVAFASVATNLVAADANGMTDVFVRDRAAASTTRMTVTCSGTEADNVCDTPSISADGRLVAWSSYADNLVSDDTNGTSDLFVTDRSFVVDEAFWDNYGSGHPGTLGIPGLVASGDPEFGATITLDATDSAPGWSVGFLVIGLQPTALPFAGGTLLVAPLLIPTVPVSPWGWSKQTTIPRDDGLCNVSVFLQMLELDSGASRGISMSAGLELHFGK